MNSVRAVAVAAVLIAVPALAPAHANETAGSESAAIDPRLVERGWSLFESAQWKPARFEAAEDDVIRVTTDNSTALIWRNLDTAVKQHRYLSWRWRVDAAMAPTDIRIKGGDDRPIALHVWFEDPPGRKSFFGSIRNTVIEALFGIPVSGRVITYVWGGTGKPGDAQLNPHIGDDSWMIVRRTGGAQPGKWLAERVDLAADFRRGFGEAPPAARMIAIAADSEDTKTASTAMIRDIRFHD
jgi:hypothetical protein